MLMILLVLVQRLMLKASINLINPVLVYKRKSGQLVKFAVLADHRLESENLDNCFDIAR